MLRHWFIAPVLALLTTGTVMSAEKLTLVPDQSKIEFIGSKADGKHTGGFKKFTSDAVADMQNPDEGSLEIAIDATSLWSDDERLTNHLKNPDFFDVRKHPTITFEATDIQVDHSAATPQAKLVGNLTMLGKTVEVSIPANVTATEELITLTTEFKMDRTKWGMTYGEGKVNNDVEVSATLVYKRK